MHATQQDRASTAKLVLSLTHVPVTQLKPSSVLHRNLNQQGRASIAHLNTPSSTHRNLNNPHFKKPSSTHVPVIHRDFNAAHLKPPSSTQVPATHSNLNLNSDVHFKMPSSTHAIGMTNEAVPTTIRYNALQSP